MSAPTLALWLDLCRNDAGCSVSQGVALSRRWLMSIISVSNPRDDRNLRMTDKETCDL